MHKIVVNSDNSHADYANEEYPAVAVRAFNKAFGRKIAAKTIFS